MIKLTVNGKMKGGSKVHSVLRLAIMKAGITIKKLASDIGVSEKTLRNKLDGVTDFTWPEAQAIRDIVSPGSEIETLFATDEEAVS